MDSGKQEEEIEEITNEREPESKMKREEEEVEEITNDREPECKMKREEKEEEIIPTQDTGVEIERETLSDQENSAKTNEGTRFGQLLGKLGMRRISLPRWCHIFTGDAFWTPHVRVYQLWPGKNVFFLRGRMICGPDPRGFSLTMISIIVSEWIFASYITDFPLSVSSTISTISLILAIIVVINLFLVGTRDPGIIPRNREKQSKETGISKTGNKSRRINIDGIEIKVKYCRICDLFRPPRSSHCAVCDNCVEKFDHHCPWIGTCIGLRNYRHYLMFVFSAFIFYLYMFVISTWRIITKKTKLNKGVFQLIAYMPETFSLAVFSLMAVWFVGGLLVFHAYLISLNQTGHERFKQKYVFSPNPYDKGAMRNIKEVLFTKLPPSTVNFRAVIKPDWTSISRELIKSPKRDEDEEIPIIIQTESSEGPSEIQEIEEIKE